MMTLTWTPWNITSFPSKFEISNVTPRPDRGIVGVPAVVLTINSTVDQMRRHIPSLTFSTGFCMAYISSIFQA
jgi:hypothetical protein